MEITLHLANYIAEPYTPERYRRIEIQKQSGMDRARSDAKRRQALEQHLRCLGMTLADWDALCKQSEIPFFTDAAGSIMIPADRMAALVANADDVAPAKLRIPNCRTLRWSDFVTDKKLPDCKTWTRFVIPKRNGVALSNQRGIRESKYIEDATATGTVEHDAELVRPDSITRLLEFAGREVGLGASRKVGWGRFTVE